MPTVDGCHLENQRPRAELRRGTRIQDRKGGKCPEVAQSFYIRIVRSPKLGLRGVTATWNLKWRQRWKRKEGGGVVMTRIRMAPSRAAFGASGSSC